MRVQAKGFKSFETRGIELLSAQSVRRTYTLEVGAVTEMVEVQASANMVNTVSAEQQQSISTREVTELPLARRNVANVIGLNTGVVRAGGDVIFNGLGRGATSITLDGRDASSNSERPASALFGDFNYINTVSVEAVQEVQTSKGVDHGTGEYKDNRATYLALFFQDDWKASSRLTLNMGLRYEPTPPWHEVAGRIEQFRIQDFQNGVRSQRFKNAPPGILSSLDWSMGRPLKSQRFKNAPPGILFRGDPGALRDGAEGDYNNLGARFGFAWDVFGDGKTSVRGGAGMFYDQHLQGDFNNGGVNAPPWSLRLSVTQPQGPFSDPYQGRNDFETITVRAIGSRDAPFPLMRERLTPSPFLRTLEGRSPAAQIAR